MRVCALAVATMGVAPAVQAQDIALKPLIDARLRWEQVAQDGLPETSDAVTLRVRSGVEASRAGWSALIEGETTIGIGQDYNDGLNGRTKYPLIADPQNIELNRAQLRYAAPAASITIGRQFIELADQRFVGAAAIRQNGQTFDAVRATWTPLPKLSIDATHAWSVRTVNGVDGRGARPTAIPGDNWFGLIGYATPVGTLTGFAYLVDQDAVAVQGFRLSSQTYGMRFAGARTFGSDWRLGYDASVARQSDYRRNPNDFAATYYIVEATLERKRLSAGIGYEVLGADRGVALTSVQTPLGAYFKVQGWAEKFNITPPNGLRRLYGTLGTGWKAIGPLSHVALTAAYHRFDADRVDEHYGDEVDLVVAAKFRAVGVSARYAHYVADRFATDTDKVWLTLEWALR